MNGELRSKQRVGMPQKELATLSVYSLPTADEAYLRQNFANNFVFGWKYFEGGKYVFRPLALIFSSHLL